MENPQSPQPPEPPPGPQAPVSPQAPAAGPQAPGPGPEAPPGGWERPIARPEQGGWAGRPLASWGTRVGALIVDGLIIGIPATIVTAALGIGAVGADSGAGVGAYVGGAIVSVLVFALVALLYAPTLMARQGEHNGQTWGKQLLGIRVVRDGGEPMSFWWAALREAGVKGLAVNIAGWIVPVLPWFLNYFWPLWDSENRALHDMVVSTHVVRA